MVFVGVYDEIQQPEYDSTESIVEDTYVDLEPYDDQEDLPPLSCLYWSGDELNKDGISYCKLTGLDPQKYEHGFDELFECPFVEMFSDNAFKDGTGLVRMDLLAIESVTNLLRALFKVNLYIAHNEYFLKMDVEDSTGWWYGYTSGDLFAPIICDKDA